MLPAWINKKTSRKLADPSQSLKGLRVDYCTLKIARKYVAVNRVPDFCGRTVFSIGGRVPFLTSDVVEILPVFA
jgi:hypothetical protein